MARVRRKSMQMAKIGFVLAIIAAVAALGAFFLMLPRWNFAEMVIEMRSKRKLAIMVALAGAVIPGLVALFTGLEGAAGCQGRLKTLGWIGFFVGAVSCMVGVVLGLCFTFYKL